MIAYSQPARFPSLEAPDLCPGRWTSSSARPFDGVDQSAANGDLRGRASPSAHDCSPMNMMLERSKRVLASIGAFVPTRRLLDLQMVLNYMRLGRWMHDHGFACRTRHVTREECWEAVVDMIGHRPVLYLEFGVYQGRSLRYWATLLTHPDSQLHGFDSFEGLPETFDERMGIDRSFHDVGGQLPRVDDARVTFHKGWFSDTLPSFTVPAHDQLVINLDADLYSSTLTVLQALDSWIVPGTFIYFDDFAHIEHEARAFADYIANTGKRFKLAATVTGFNCSVFACVPRDAGPA